ncbi:MAG: glycosyltransferase [Acidobacteriales bacterium]|nr:glycosyltransferase [Terriglobales bacterium]
MRIGIIAPSPVPFSIGGAENLFWGLLNYLNQETIHQAELIKLPSREHGFWELVDTYRDFSRLDLRHFDCVISGKYPAWMSSHRRHICYMLHRLRGLYDMYHFTGLPPECSSTHPAVRTLVNRLKTIGDRRDRTELAFQALDEFRATPDIPQDVLQFPGPLIRQVLHVLDDAALHPSRIFRYAATARNQLGRTGYFPPGVDVRVLHHPSNLSRFWTGDYEYLFTIGRLDGAKRIRLLVEAMRRATSRIRLKIAGSGPDEEEIKRLADGDPRIEFLGFVKDSDAIDLYANALAVLYVPYDEDYGLVTIEAMMSGKPVLTALDSGEPNVFVRDGVTGYSVEPTVEALAERIDYIAGHPVEARAMAEACRKEVEGITWGAVVTGLLGPSRRSGAWKARGRRKLTMACTFPVYPPRGGGQNRVFHLYRNLARDFDVDSVTFTDYGQPAKNEYIAPDLREIRVPKSLAHAQRERDIMTKVGDASVADVAMPVLYKLTPDYVEALRQSAATSQILVASHPYLFPALEEVREKQTLIYEAQDVEAELKRSILPDSRMGSALLKLTEAVERRACQWSDLIVTCLDDDAVTLHRKFDVPEDRFVVVPNGVDLDSVTFHSIEDRRALKQRLHPGAPFTVLFMGSLHGPNIDAVLCILAIAQELPNVGFLLVGGVCNYLERFGFQLPLNVKLAGIVDDQEKDEILSWVNLAINPMESGSGTNLKMLDYLAAGVPVLSTPFGARGLNLRDGEHGWLAPLERFPTAIQRIAGTSDSDLAAMVERARGYAVRLFAWEVVAEQLRQAIHQYRFDE